MNARFAGLALALAAGAAGLTSALAAPAAKPTSDSVTIASGVLKGTRLDTGVVSFLGVPYAAPPVGPLRFREPQPAADWTGVRLAQTEPKGCIATVVGPDRSEDCLYLDVWAPAQAPPSGKKYPVLMWTPGGNGRIGPGFDGGRLAAKGVVVVTVNRRLNLLGGFSTPGLSAESPNHVSGNQGRLDLIMALKWIRTNAAAFGGDTGNVTMSGFSGGSLSTAALQTSPMTQGLYHKVMAQSASVFGMDRDLIQPLAQAEAAGQKFMDDSKLDLAALRALTPQQLLALPARRALPGAGVMVVDGYMLKEHPRDAFMAGRAAKVPALLGSATGENIGGVITGVKSRADFETKLQAAFAKDPAGLAEAARLYPVSSDRDAVLQSGKFNTEASVNARMRFWAYHLAAHSPAPVWLYTFNVPVGGGDFAKHGDDVAFIFCTMDKRGGGGGEGGPGPAPAAFKPNDTPEDYALCDRMEEATAAFLRTGNPNTAAVKWPRYDAKAERTIVFDKPRDKVTTVSPGIQFFARKAESLLGRAY